MDEKYKYTYEQTSDYCYHNSDVLKNKLNIRSDKELFIAEREFVSYRMAILLDKPQKGNFDFEHLKSIHKTLFQDIYYWAGVPRTCNIAKTNLFCLATYIETYAKDVFGKIADNYYYLNLDYNNKIKALAELFADINALHPFREGNGRSQRLFIKQLANIIGVNLDFTKVNEKEMIISSSESISGDMEKLIAIFNRIANQTSKEEQIESVDRYIKDKKLARILKENM